MKTTFRAHIVPGPFLPEIGQSDKSWTRMFIGIYYSGWIDIMSNLRNSKTSIWLELNCAARNS